MSIPFDRWFPVLALAVTACGGGGSGDGADAAADIDAASVPDSAPDIDSEPPPPSAVWMLVLLRRVMLSSSRLLSMPVPEMPDTPLSWAMTSRTVTQSPKMPRPLPLTRSIVQSSMRHPSSVRTAALLPPGTLAALRKVMPLTQM